MMNIDRLVHALKRLVCTTVTVALLAPVAIAQTTEDLINPPPGEWPTHNRTLDGLRFSPLDQINRENVDQLRLAWSRSLGYEGSLQSSPVVWDGVMYINGIGVVHALDATNGDLIWEYRPVMSDDVRGVLAARMRGGVVVHEGLVYYARNDGIVVALDAEDGEVVWETPIGNVELAEGFSAGPIFADGRIIVGVTGADTGGAPGRIHALDREDGELLWSFNVIPEPGEPGYDTWTNPPSWEDGIGGGAAWNPGAYDPETNTIIWGTGQPIPWERFTDRRRDDDGQVSADLYTATYLGLDPTNGELKWYYQVVPGDEWDYDVQTTPTITDLEIDGETRRVAILPTTPGYIVLVDAGTGEFLRASDCLQPECMIVTGFDADGNAIINEAMRISEAGQTVDLTPMRHHNFQQASYDPNLGIYFRPNVYESREFTPYGIPDDWEPGQRPLDHDNIVIYDRFERFGGITAYDPVTFEVVWDYGHGYDQRGGLVATAGNLVFAVFEDRHFRAFDSETGEVLWEQVLPTMMRSNPISYSVGDTQYVAALVGHGSAQQARADLPPTVPGPAAVFVFALPEGAR
jgi:alcohol dehydrogenase (cytochrome c)